jgi:hypothetical protein
MGNMNYRLSALFGACLLCVSPVGNAADLITFDDLSPGQDWEVIQKRYGGLEWGDGGTSPSGPVQVSFSDLTGTPPDFSESDSVLSDSHGFFGFAEISSAPFTNEFTFTSMTITGTVVAQHTGLGARNFIPHSFSRLAVSFHRTNERSGALSVHRPPVSASHDPHHGGVAGGWRRVDRAGPRRTENGRGRLRGSGALDSDQHEYHALYVLRELSVRVCN